jgi:hypothetical protein
MLNEVPIGFEIWRQLNGFPPVLPHKVAAGGKSDKGEKKK